jgi:ABC-2 type transport system permease protein
MPVDVSELATTQQARSTGRPRAAAGMLVYWVVVNGCFMATFLTEDRARGVIQRTAAGPVPANAIVAGELLGRVALTFVQGVAIVLLSSSLLGATWGGTVPLVFVLAALSLVAAGISVLLGILIQRPGPEAAIQVIAVAAVLGLTGGCFWTLAFVPSAMRTLAYVTPHAWAMRALESTSARGVGLAGIAPELCILAGFGVGLLIVATYGLHRATVARGG